MTYYNKPAPFDVGVEQRIIDVYCVRSPRR